MSVRVQALLGLSLGSALGLAATLLVADQARAQMPMPSISLGQKDKRPLTPEEQEQQRKLDDAYNAAQRKIPDQKANDPWSDVRSSGAAKGSGTATAGTNTAKNTNTAKKKPAPAATTTTQ